MIYTPDHIFGPKLSYSVSHRTIKHFHSYLMGLSISIAILVQNFNYTIISIVFFMWHMNMTKIVPSSHAQGVLPLLRELCEARGHWSRLVGHDDLSGPSAARGPSWWMWGKRWTWRCLKKERLYKQHWIVELYTLVFVGWTILIPSFFQTVSNSSSIDNFETFDFWINCDCQEF